MLIDAPLASEVELAADPLSGTTGYRVRSAVAAGSCEGDKRDGCPAGQSPGACRSTGGHIRCSCKPCPTPP